MIRQKAISDRLLLGVIFFGMNVLCFLGITHGHHVTRHTRVNYSHVQVHSSRRAGGRGDYHSVTATVDAYLDHSVVDHTPQVTLSKAPVAGTVQVQPAVISNIALLPRPEARTEPLSQESVIALGSAPRAPGLGRAPPISA